MRRRMMLGITMMVAMAQAAWAVEGREVALHGGTVKTIPVGTVGLLDLNSAEALVFEAGERSIAMPYASMTQVSYKAEVAHHLGVLPALAVSMVKKRERRHYFTLTYSDSGGAAQVLVLEVSKGMPGEVMQTIAARAPQVCRKPGECRVVE